MPLAYYRLNPIMVLRLIITVWTAFIVAFGPNYQKLAYKDTPAVDYVSYINNVGYPAGNGYPVVRSVEDTLLYDNYIIEIDVENLEATNRYKDNILGKKVYRGAFVRAINNNLSDYGIGQYYVATLESGEKIILFLDDTALDLPRTGKVILPVGQTIRVKKNNVFDYIQEEFRLEDENTVWYVDMVGYWRESEQMKALQEKKTYMYLGTMVGMIIIQVVIHVIYIKVSKRTEDSKDV